MNLARSGAAALCLLVPTIGAAGIAPDSLRLSRSATDVQLSWMAGVGPYSVYRSTNREEVAVPIHHVGTTVELSYDDPLQGLPEPLYFYLVRDFVDCAADVDCDDRDPCNGFEVCDAESGTCTIAPVLERSLVDRPDDFEGPQLHMTYVLPNDGTDDELDINGQLADEVRVAQNWLLEQVGSCLRFDTYQGSLDVTFARLSRTNEELRTDPNFVDQTLRLELEGLGLADPEKLNVVYYGGTTDNNGCGGGAALGGGGPAVQFLVRRTDPHGPLTPCPFFSFVSGPDDVVRDADGVRWAGVALHESFHSLGVVPFCAPDSNGGGHLETISSDIMAFDGTGFDYYTLDESRTQYYDHRNIACLDLANSATWYDAPAVPDPIPGNTVYVEPIFIPCRDEPGTSSASGGVSAQIRFVNVTPRTLQFYWIDFSGVRQPSATLPPFSDWCCGGTSEYHVFVATDADTRECLGLYEMVPGLNRILIVE